MELTLARRVGAALAATGLAVGVFAAVAGVGRLAARPAVAGTSTDPGLITGVGFPAVGGGAAARPPTVEVLAEPVTHDHGPDNFQSK